MGTQSVVSVVNGKEVLVKCVAGCSCCEEEKFAKKLASQQLTDVDAVYAFATEFGFGCSDCTVVMDSKKILGDNDGDLEDSLYRETFSNPKFNPRWERGTASNVYIVHTDNWNVETVRYGDLNW